MHLYDLAMLGLLGLLAWSGFRRGFVREVAGLAAFALGFLLAFRLAGPLGRWLATVFPSLSPTTAHVVAFLAVVLLVGLAIDLAALFLTGAISLVPVVGGLNRVGGLVAGAALGVLVIWLLTTCLLLLPPTLLPFTSAVRRSETAQLVRGVPAAWSHGLRTSLAGSGAAGEDSLGGPRFHLSRRRRQEVGVEAQCSRFRQPIGSRDLCGLRRRHDFQSTLTVAAVPL